MRTAAVAAGSTGSAHADRPAAGSSRRVRRVRRAGGVRPGADNGVGPFVVAGRHGGTTVARRCRDRGQGPYLPPAAVARPGTRRGTRPRRRRGRARAGHTRPSVAAPRRGRPYPTAHDVRTAVIHRRTRRGGRWSGAGGGGPSPDHRPPDAAGNGTSPAPAGCRAGRVDRSAADLARLDAGGADLEPLGGAAHHGAHRLDVGVPAAAGAAVGVGDVVAEGRLLAADLANGCHRNRSFRFTLGPTRPRDLSLC